MAAPNRWAVREAAEVTFYDIITNLPIVTLNTLKMTEVSTTGETVYAMGGRGNAKLVAFSGNREAQVTLQDALFDNAALAMLTGNVITSGNRDVMRQEIATATTAAAFPTPSGTPKGTPTYADAITGAPIALATGIKVGDKIRIYYVEAKTAAKTITVSADKFGGTFKMVADVVVKDAQTGELAYGQFIAPRAKVNDEFTFNFAPDGDPSVLDIPIEILKDPNSNLMYELVLF